MRDRIPADPGRVKMTRSDGTFEYVTLERADNPTQEGTPLNKALLDYAVAACGVTAGTATALTLDDAFGGFTLVDGAKVNFRLHVASGANPTLNVNGTGAKALVDVYGMAMQPEATEGAWITAKYSAVNDSYVVEAMKYTEPPRRPDILDIIDTSDGAYEIDIPLLSGYSKYIIDLCNPVGSSLGSINIAESTWSLKTRGIVAGGTYRSTVEYVLDWGATPAGDYGQSVTSSGTTSSFELLQPQIVSKTLRAPLSAHIEIQFVNNFCVINSVVESIFGSSDLHRTVIEKNVIITDPTISSMGLVMSRTANNGAQNILMIIKGEK